MSAHKPYSQAAHEWAKANSTHFGISGVLVTFAYVLIRVVLHANGWVRFELVKVEEYLIEMPVMAVAALFLWCGDYVFKFLFQAPSALYAEAQDQIRRLSERLEVNPQEGRLRSEISKILEQLTTEQLTCLRQIWASPRGLSRRFVLKSIADMQLLHLLETCAGFVERKHNFEGAWEGYSVTECARGALDFGLTSRGA
ncbi:MAG: hypothetical protein U0R19_37555 [Bryobacteraceae bacterium]